MLPDKLLTDSELVEEILDKAKTADGLPQANDYNLTPAEVGEFLKTCVEESQDTASEKFPEEKARLAEAVILTIGRPAILIQNNTFLIPQSDVWGSRLEEYRLNIEKAIRSVGRIEVTNHPRGFSYLGTGWLVAADIIVTNRHVAEAFSRKDGDKFTFRKNPVSKQAIGVNLDFREEFQVDTQEQFQVLDILHIEDGDSPDIAFIKIDTEARVGGTTVKLQSNAIVLADTPIQDESEVATIGYPAEDSRRNPLPDPQMKEIFGDIYDVKRLQPGNIKSVQAELITHDCSTLGGNSGSVVIDLKSGAAVGLHFGGKFLEENYAVPAQIIRERLEMLGG